MLMRKLRPPHQCKTKMKPLKSITTAQSADNLLYTFENNQYCLYKVLECLDNNEFKCVELNIEDKKFQRHQSLNFGKVGVFKNHGLTTVERVLNINEVNGKVFSRKGLLFTVSMNVLEET